MQDPNFLIVHSDEVFTEITPEFFEKGERSEEYCPALVKDLLSVNGIKTVDFESYSMMIEKGQVFEWEGILALMLIVFNVNFGECQEKAPPFCSVLEKSRPSTTEVEVDGDPDDSIVE